MLSRAIVPPQELSPAARSCTSRSSRAISTASSGRARCRAIAISSPTTRRKIVAERPINIRTLERYLLLRGDLPGFKFKNNLQAVGDPAGRRHPGGRGHREAARLARPRRQPRHQGARARAVIHQRHASTISARMHEAWTLSYAGAIPVERAAIRAGELSAGPHQRRPDALRQQQLQPRPARHARAASCCNTRPAAICREPACSYPFIRSRETQPDRHGAVLHQRRPQRHLRTPLNTLDRMRGVRLKADADFADPLRGINQVNLILSQGIRGSAAPVTGNPSACRGPTGGSTSPSSRRPSAACSRWSGNFSILLAGLYPVGLDSAPVARAVRLRRPPFGRAYDPSELVGRQLRRWCWRSCATTSPTACKPVSQLQLYALRRPWLAS